MHQNNDVTWRSVALFPSCKILIVPETFRVRNTILSSSVSEKGKVYAPETSLMKGTSVNIENMSVKQLCYRKVRDFAMALQARNVSGASEKRAKERFWWLTD